MATIVYVTSENTVRFECPKCQKAKTVDAARFSSLNRIARIRVTCPCGHAYVAILEKRRGYRKQVDLPGTYVLTDGGRDVRRGHMTVKDLSAGGAKLRVTNPQGFSVGDILRLEFRLDDTHHSLVRKKAVVRNIEEMHIGTEFIMTEATDKVLGFYLLS